MLEAVPVFFSYAPKDQALRDELAAHLAPLERNGVIRSRTYAGCGPAMTARRAYGSSSKGRG